MLAQLSINWCRIDAHLSTPKQIRLLEVWILSGTWDFESASRMITRIANNGWFHLWYESVSYQP